MSRDSDNEQMSVVEKLFSGAQKMKTSINFRIEKTDNSEELAKLKEEIRMLDLILHGF